MTTADAKVELVARLRQLRIVLKSGDYDGADLMRAWCAMADAADTIETALEAPHSMTEAMIEAGIQALTVLYRGDGGWIGKEAAREQVLRTWNAMQAARPIDELTQGNTDRPQGSTGEAGASDLSTPIAPVQDDDAEWLRRLATIVLTRGEWLRLERIANRLGNQSVGKRESKEKLMRRAGEEYDPSAPQS